MARSAGAHLAMTSALVLIVAVTGLAGCERSGNDSPPATASTPAASTPAAPPTAPTTAPDPTAATEPSGTVGATTPVPTNGLAPMSQRQGPRHEPPSQHARLKLVEIRSAVHRDYDRIVLEFQGPGRPGWSADFTDRPVADGSGFAIEIAGDTALSVHVSGLVMPSGTEAKVPPDLWDPQLKQVREIQLGGWFEGQQQLVLGLPHRCGYRIFTLPEPSRLVIDIQHGDS